MSSDLWEQLLYHGSKHEVRFEWVRRHSGNRENERCDQLSQDAARGMGCLPTSAMKAATPPASPPVLGQPIPINGGLHEEARQLRFEICGDVDVELAHAAFGGSLEGLDERLLALRQHLADVNPGSDLPSWHAVAMEQGDRKRRLPKPDINQGAVEH